MKKSLAYISLALTFFSLFSMNRIEKKLNTNSRIVYHFRGEKNRKFQLYEYAIKELIEKHHEESELRKSQQCQKWTSFIVGTLTTTISSIVAIISITSENGSSCNCITMTPNPYFNITN